MSKLPGFFLEVIIGARGCIVGQVSEFVTQYSQAANVGLRDETANPPYKTSANHHGYTQYCMSKSHIYYVQQ